MREENKFHPLKHVILKRIIKANHNYMLKLSN